MAIKNGCALLAGGRGCRMGEVNKARLKYEGVTFADRIMTEMKKSGLPCYISSATYEQEIPEGWNNVKDKVTDLDGRFIGPIGGIYSCLKQAEHDGLDGMFFAPCDAPFFRKDAIEKLSQLIDEDSEAAIWCTPDGRMQTTFGWYSVKMLPIFEEDIRNGHFKILKSLEKCRLITADIYEAGIDERTFLNINTKADYLHIDREFSEKRHILISGQRGSGKTTLIERIKSETTLSVHGYRTAIDKIDNNGVKTICMYPACENGYKKAKGGVIGHSRNKVLDVDYDTFDDLGVRLISERDDNSILIMDEIGYMEIGSEWFCREVIRAFNENSYIIASIKAEDHGYKYLRMIKNHPSVTLFDLTEDNRQEVYAAVKEIVSGWEKRQQKGDGLS